MNEFIEAVSQMRRSQKEYFSNRNYTTLHQAMDDERNVDQMLVNIKSDARQMELKMEAKP